MTDFDQLGLPSTWDGFMAALEDNRQAQWEAAVLEITDAALGRAGDWHLDCPVVEFLRLLRNDPHLTSAFIREARARREG